MDSYSSDIWWQEKLQHGYSVQPKHLAVCELVDDQSFPLADLGAGNGLFLHVLENIFDARLLSGVEMSATAIMAKLCRAPIENSDIMEWRPKRQIRTLTLVDVLEHLINPASCLRHLSEIAPYLIIACPNFNFVTARLDMLLGQIPFQNRVGRGGHVYWCQYKSLHSLFQDTGYVILKTNHLYPRHSVLKNYLSTRPSLFAHEFVFLLASRRYHHSLLDR